MSERIIPGVSFNEIEEGLIGTPTPGAVGVLLVGTACKGPTAEPQFFGSDQLQDLITMFGPPDPYKYKNGHANEPPAELTLTRAAIEVFNGGPPPGGLWVMRATETSVVKGIGQGMLIEANDGAEASGADGIPGAGVKTFTNTAATNFAAAGVVAGDLLTISDGNDAGTYYIKTVATTTLTIEDWYDVFTGDTGNTFSVDSFNDDGNFVFTAKYAGAWYNNAKMEVVRQANLLGAVDRGLTVVRVQIPSNIFFDSYYSGSPTEKVSGARWYGQTIELEVGTPGATHEPTLAVILAALQANTVLAQYYVISSTTTAGFRAKATTGFQDLFATGNTGGTNWSADDNSIIVAVSIKAAVDKLLHKDGRVLVIGGCDETVLAGAYITEGVAAARQASQAGVDRERVFVTGTGNYTTEAALVTAVETSPYPLAQERAVPVTPGTKSSNLFFDRNYGFDYVSAKDPDETIMLSGGYAAARLAGILAFYAPDDSALNKSLGVLGLEHELTRASVKRVIAQSFTILAVNFDNSIVVRRALTSAGVGDAFYQIATRMAVDEIRIGLRLAAQPFLGTKNNARIRSIMQDNLQSVLNGYVAREIINPGFSLSATATRGQEIIGVVKVTAVVQVVFYTEFIEIDLTLT